MKYDGSIDRHGKRRRGFTSDLNTTNSVSDFNHNTDAFLRRLKQTGEPEVLTVNGEAEIVVQSAAAYQKLLETAELSETLQVLRNSLDESRRGEGRPARDVLRELAVKAQFELEG